MRRHEVLAQDARAMEQIRREITAKGVAIATGIELINGHHRTLHYTVGLTRYEGHPELVVVGTCCECSENVLRGAADAVRDGARLAPGWGVDVDGWSHLAIEVEDPTLAVLAQWLYRVPGGPVVHALQLVPTDDWGEFPWESGVGFEYLLGPVPDTVEYGAEIDRGIDAAQQGE